MPSAAGAAAGRLQLRQRRGKLQGRNQLQALAIEQPQQHLQHVFPQRVGRRVEKDPRVVTRRRLQQPRWDRSCCRRPARRSSGRCSRRVAGIRPAAGRRGGRWSNRRGCGRSRHPATRRRRSWPENSGRSNWAASRRPGGDGGHGGLGQMLPAGQQRGSCRRRPAAARGDCSPAAAAPWSAARRSADAVSHRGGAPPQGCVVHVDAGVQADRRQRPGRVGLQDAQAQRLRHVAGVIRPPGRAAGPAG